MVVQNSTLAALGIFSVSKSHGFLRNSVCIIIKTNSARWPGVDSALAHIMILTMILVLPIQCTLGVECWVPISCLCILVLTCVLGSLVPRLYFFLFLSSSQY